MVKGVVVLRACKHIADAYFGVEIQESLQNIADFDFGVEIDIRDMFHAL